DVVHGDRPLARRQESRDHPERRRLAAARWAEERDELPVRQREAEGVHRGDAPEAAAHVVEHQLAHEAVRRSMKSRPTRRSPTAPTPTVPTPRSSPTEESTSKFPSSLLSKRSTDSPGAPVV